MIIIVHHFHIYTYACIIHLFSKFCHDISCILVVMEWWQNFCHTWPSMSDVLFQCIIRFVCSHSVLKSAFIVISFNLFSFCTVKYWVHWTVHDDIQVAMIRSDHGQFQMNNCLFGTWSFSCMTIDGYQDIQEKTPEIVLNVISLWLWIMRWIYTNSWFVWSGMLAHPANAIQRQKIYFIVVCMLSVCGLGSNLYVESKTGFNSRKNCV